MVLPFVIKLFQKTVLSPPLILFYAHSTENALFRVPNDLFVAI